MRFVTKIIFSLVLLQFLMMAAGSLLVFHQTRSELRQDFAKRAESIATSLSVGIQRELCLNNSQKSVETMLEKVLAAGELDYVLVRAEGTITAKAGNVSLAIQNFDNSQIVGSTFEESRVFTTFASIEPCALGGKESELEVGMNFQVLDRPLVKLINTEMLSLLFQAIFALVLAAFAKRIVDRKIDSIEYTCARISTGDFLVRADSRGSDEYATIGKALNKTIEALQALTIESDRQRQELAMQSKLSSLGEMAGGVAHEINNPLAIIALRAEQLEEGLDSEELDKAAMKEFVAVIQKTVTRIASITRGLRLFSRNAENDAKVDVSLKSVIEDSVNLCSERFRSSGIALRINYQSLARVNGRATQISQVLVNLLNNAYDAVHDCEEKWVEINLNKGNGNSVILSVMDSGPGVPIELRQKIMQPFFTTKAVGKGTGLGLSISRGIIEEHQGKFYLDESSPHTRFCLELPEIK